MVCKLNWVDLEKTKNADPKWHVIILCDPERVSGQYLFLFVFIEERDTWANSSTSAAAAEWTVFSPVSPSHTIVSVQSGWSGASLHESRNEICLVLHSRVDPGAQGNIRSALRLLCVWTQGRESKWSVRLQGHWILICLKELTSQATKRVAYLSAT